MKKWWIAAVVVLVLLGIGLIAHLIDFVGMIRNMHGG